MDSKVIKYDGELKVTTPFKKTGFEISSPRMRTRAELDLAKASGSYGLK
jgi:hypothetical protein